MEKISHIYGSIRLVISKHITRDQLSKELEDLSRHEKAVLVEFEQEVEKKLAETKQLQEQQQQLQTAESMGKAMPGLNQEIVEGSPAEALL